MRGHLYPVRSTQYWKCIIAFKQGFLSGYINVKNSELLLTFFTLSDIWLFQITVTDFLFLMRSWHFVWDQRMQWHFIFPPLQTTLILSWDLVDACWKRYWEEVIWLILSIKHSCYLPLKWSAIISLSAKSKYKPNAVSTASWSMVTCFY